MNYDNVYCLIMAGGVGRRFWPMSRVEHPKQFLKFFGDRSLLQMTVDRIRPLISPDNVLIVTNERYKELTAGQLPEVPEENILLEPVSRNTAPCIAYGASVVRKSRPDAVMLVLPADHLIRDVAEFHNVLKAAIAKAAEPDTLVTIGIQPGRPATGYGYIEFEPGDSNAHRVRSFTEKPDADRATSFIEAGNFLWNSGMFVWRTDAIWREIERNLPDVHREFGAVTESPLGDRKAVRKAFLQSPSISVDYGIMEKAEKVFVVRGDFGWSDVGDWQAAYDVAPKDADANAEFGDVHWVDSKRSLAYASERTITMLGLEDIVVVDAGDTVLVCHRSQAQRVKEAANRAEES